jgi:hypothetical protein
VEAQRRRAGDDRTFAGVHLRRDCALHGVRRAALEQVDAREQTLPESASDPYAQGFVRHSAGCCLGRGDDAVLSGDQGSYVRGEEFVDLRHDSTVARPDVLR